MSENNIQHSDNDSSVNSVYFLKKAQEANESGDTLLSVYLYLAAFQKSLQEHISPTKDALSGLKEAWTLACDYKARSMSEYIFEILEPYLTSDEISKCADQLQNLAMDKLEEFGLSRNDLDELAQAISEDLSFDLNSNSGLNDFLHSVSVPFNLPEIEQASVEEGPSGASDGAELPVEPDEPQPSFASEDASLNYSNISGYDGVIKVMQTFGIGCKDDPAFDQLIDMLNARHGLSSKPALDSLLLRAASREDANRFMLATVGELGVPYINMRMEQNLQGMPVLCISTPASTFPTSRSLKDVFNNGGVLVLENIDLWETPTAPEEDEFNQFFMMQLTRGAREAVGMIRSAVENPDIYVIATSSSDGIIDDFFLELLEPLSLIDIDLPTSEERNTIWMDIAKQHPSFRSISRSDLVSYSENLSRYDIWMASREAIEEAYKAGLSARRYFPVTRENILDKIAAYQPLDSKQYAALEDELIRDFQNDLDHIDDLLEGE